MCVSTVTLLNFSIQTVKMIYHQFLAIDFEIVS